MNIVVENRIGKISISIEEFRTNPDVALNMQRDILVIRVETLHDAGRINFYGYSKHFESRVEGDAAPEYVRIRTPEGEVIFKQILRAVSKLN